jgi:DNA-binding transcriptional LysR family regulator
MDDLRLLKVLREVVRRGSFSAAAEALAYTQPAVSQQIARLERQVGVALLERSPRAVRPTPAGEVLVRHTERILTELAEAEAEVQDLTTQARGRVRIAAFSTAAGTIVPRALAAFRRERPAVTAELTLLDPPEAIPALRRGEFELVLAEEGGLLDEPDFTDLVVEHLLDDELYVALPAGHALAARPAVALGDLRDEGWMLVGLRGTCQDSNIVLRACAHAGFQPDVLYGSDDYFAIVGLVASGMGVALVPGLGLAAERDDVVVRPVRGRAPVRRIVAVAAREPAGAVAAMLARLHDAASHFADAGVAAAA